MLKNYLKIALRTLKRNKGYAVINIAGFSVGLAACLLIALFVRHELSFDRFFSNSDRVYRIVQMGNASPFMESWEEGHAVTPPGLAGVIEGRFPEIERATVVLGTRNNLFALDEDKFYLDHAFAVDSAFLSVFPYELLRGNADEALAAPQQIVISESVARQLFGDENPLGQTLLYENETAYTISGVMQNPPAHSHFRPHVLLSLTLEQRGTRYGEEIMWNHYSGWRYVMLEDDSSPSELQAKLRAMEKKAQRPGGARFAVQPVTAIHLYSNLSGEIAPQSDVRYLYLFSLIGLLLLLIACVNYVNLSTARATQRAREVGIRKVAGANRVLLVRQFLGESIFVSLLALPVTLVLARLALPLVNQVLRRELVFDVLFGGWDWFILPGVILLIGLAAGLYPAINLSRFRPAQILRGTAIGAKGGRLRQGLVVFQFVASTVLIIATLVVYLQLDFIQQKDLGYNEERLVTFRIGDLGTRYGSFKQSLLQHPEILSVTSGPPPGIGRKNMTFTMSPTSDTALTMLRVDHEYVETVGLNLVAGHAFSRSHSYDAETAVLLTETAARLLGMSEDPIGRTVEMQGTDRAVIGVVGDFHNESLYEAVQPVVITLNPGNNWLGIVRLAPGSIEAGLDALRKTWSAFLPNRPFRFEYLQDEINAQYQASERLARLFGIFAGLTALVGCLGLLGLAAFTAQSRTKEIGIRKVLGAHVMSVVALLSKDYMKLVAAAFVIGAPVAYAAMKTWLENFAYRIELEPWLFAAAGILVLFIAMVTVSYQGIRAALTDPAKALRSE